MTPDDDAHFQTLSGCLPQPAPIELHLTADPRSAELERFCRRIAARVPAVRILTTRTTGREPPAILLPGGVRFLCVPTGAEAAPFVAAVAGRSPLPPPEILNAAAAIRLPASVDLYIMPRCTFCPTAVGQLAGLAAAIPLLRVRVIDGALFPELAERDRIRAVPTAVLDGSYRWSGTIDLREMTALMVSRDPAALGPVSLELMLKEGAARRLAEMMRERNAFFPALLDLLCHPEWPVRLGAMVAVEELAEVAPSLAREALDRLWKHFATAADPVRGDILFLSGEAGGPWLHSTIQAVITSDAAPELKEAAAEALEKIASKAGAAPPDADREV
jgi:hypothetical protein